MKIFKEICSVFVEWIGEMLWYVDHSMYGFVSILEWFVPLFSIAMYKYIGIYEAIILSIVLMVVIRFIKRLANKRNVGDSVPVPGKRFTTEDDDGEVTIENSRLQELILYINDIENWLERKGML